MCEGDAEAVLLGDPLAVREGDPDGLALLLKLGEADFDAEGLADSVCDGEPLAD